MPRVENGRIDIGAFELEDGNNDNDNDSLGDGWELTHGLDPFDDGSSDIDNGPNGGAQYGAGISCGLGIYRNRLYLENVAIVNNEAMDYGGGIYAWNCSLTIVNTEIRDNAVGVDGGGAGIDFSEGNMMMTNVKIIGNKVDSIGVGGGMNLKNCNVTIMNSEIRNNVAPIGVLVSVEILL